VFFTWVRIRVGSKPGSGSVLEIKSGSVKNLTNNQDEEETVIVEPPEEKVEQVVVPSIQPAKVGTVQFCLKKIVFCA